MKKEGYTDANECVGKIKELAAADKVRAEEKMAELMQQLDTFMKSLTGPAEGAEQEEDEKKEAPEIPTLLFYQPQSLDSLLETVLNLAEYETFAQMMRLRAGQQKMMAQLAIMFQGLTEQMGALNFMGSELEEEMMLGHAPDEEKQTDGESTARRGEQDTDAVNMNDVQVEDIDEEEVI